MADTAMRIEDVEVAAYRIPTDAPESDGSFAWDSTTMVLVVVAAGGRRGLGYSYTHEAAAALIRDEFRALLVGRDAFAIPALWLDLRRAARNLGRPGIASMAIAAIDTALWDVKAKAMGLPLARLLGPGQVSVPVYGSGGFTSYAVDRLEEQLAAWVADGVRQVKIKVGRTPDEDAERVRRARTAIGAEAALFVDANGAYSRKQALWFADRFADDGVTWFEEPVSSDDLDGLRLVRDRAPGGMEIAAGEYGFDAVYFRHMLAAGAVDVLQADATRCAGFTGFLQAAAIAEAFQVPLSAHTAPALHLHVCCALPVVRHLEYFHDHVRVEEMLFDGVQAPHEGRLFPDVDRPGHGLALRAADAERYVL